MGHTLHRNMYHLIWSTKHRDGLIIPEHKQQIFAFIAGAFKSARCIPMNVGGMSDHVHVLVAIPPRVAVSEVVRDVKVCSSKWCNANIPVNIPMKNTKKFSWQEGFGSFSVSQSQHEIVYKYIANQEAHHKVMTFKEEFVEFLKLHQIEYDEKYVWE